MAQVDNGTTATQSVAEAFRSGELSRVTAELSSVAIKFSKELRDCRDGDNLSPEDIQRQQDSAKKIWADAGLLPTLLNGFHTLILENENVKKDAARTGGDECAHLFDQLVRVSELCGSITSLMRGTHNDVELDSVSGEYSSHPYADVFVAMVMRHLWNLRAADAFSYPWMLFFLFHANGSTRNQYLQANLLSFCLWIGEQYVRETQPSSRAAAFSGDASKPSRLNDAGQLPPTSVADGDTQERSADVALGNVDPNEDRSESSSGIVKPTLPAHIRTLEQRFDAITTCGARLGALYATADVKALWRITQEANQLREGSDVRQLMQLPGGDAYLLVDRAGPSQGGDLGSSSAVRGKEAPRHSKQAHRRVCALMSEELHSWFTDRPRKTAAVLRTTFLMGLTMYLHVKGGDVDENAQGALDSLAQFAFVALDLQDASVVETLLRVTQDQTLRCDSELFHVYGEPFSLTGSCGTPDANAAEPGDGSSTPYNFLLQLWQAYYVASSTENTTTPTTTTLATSPSCTSRIVWFWAMLAYEVTHAVKGSSFLSQAATVFVANIVPVMEKHASLWEYSHGASLLMHYFLEIADAVLQSRQCPDDVFDIFCVEDFHLGWSSLNLYIQEYTKAVLTSPDVWELIGMAANPKHEHVEGVSEGSTFWWPNKPFNVTKHRIRLLRHYAVVTRALKDGGDYVEGWVCTEHPARFLANATTGPIMRILTYGVPHTSTTNMTALRFHALQLLQELARPDPAAEKGNGCVGAPHRDGVAHQHKAFFRSHDAAAYSRVLYLKFLQMFRRSCDQPCNRELTLLTTALSQTVRVFCQASEAAVREAERLGVPVMISNEMDRVRAKMLAISALENEDDENLEECADASTWLYSVDPSQGAHADDNEPLDVEAMKIDGMSEHTIEMRTDNDSDTSEREIVVDIEADESGSDEPPDDCECTGESFEATVSELPPAAPAIPKLSLGGLLPPMYFMSNGDTAAMQEQTCSQAQAVVSAPADEQHDQPTLPADQGREWEETLGSPPTSSRNSLLSRERTSRRASVERHLEGGGTQADRRDARANGDEDATIEVDLDGTVARSHVSSPKHRRSSRNISSALVATQLSGLFADDTLHSEILYLMMSLIIGKNGMIREYYTQLMATETKYTFVLFSLQHHCLHSVSEPTATRLRELVMQDCVNPGVRVLFRFLDRYSSARHDSLSLSEHIGRGAYGTVFAVQMPFLPGDAVGKKSGRNCAEGQKLAVKTAPAPHHHHDREAIVSFHAEALALLRTHGQRGIVSMADFGFDGVHYVVMMSRYRMSLKAWRAATFPRNAATDRQSVWKSLVVTYRTLCIVEALHAVRIRHNDIKADNIFLDVVASENDEDGITNTPSAVPELYLGDYGESDCISERYRPSTERSRGTEAVRPPEELIPHAFADAKLRADRILTSDVWSCGCLLYEMLTGEMLFEQTHIGKLFGYIAGEEDIFEPWHVEAIHEAGEDVVAILRSLLHWDPTERPSATKAKSLLQDLFESTKWNTATGIAKETDWCVSVLNSEPKDRHADETYLADERMLQQCCKESEGSGNADEERPALNAVVRAAESTVDQAASLDPWCVRILPNIAICQEDANITDIYALGATHVVAFRRDVPFSDHVFCLDASVVSSVQWEVFEQLTTPTSPGGTCQNAVSSDDDEANEKLDAIASFLFEDALPFLLGAVHKNGFALIPAFSVGRCNVAHLLSALFISVTYAVPAIVAALHACTQDESTGVDVYTCASIMCKIESRLSSRVLADSFTMFPSIVRTTSLTSVHTKLVASQAWLQENNLCTSSFAEGTEKNTWFRCVCGALCYQVGSTSRMLSSRRDCDGSTASPDADMVAVEHSTSSGVITLSIPKRLMIPANGEGDCEVCAPEILAPVTRFLDAVSNVYPGLLPRLSPIPLLEAAGYDDGDDSESDTREDGDHEVCADCRMPTLLSFGGVQYELGMFPLFVPTEAGAPDPVEINTHVERSLAALWGNTFHLRRINAPQLWW